MKCSEFADAVIQNMDRERGSRAERLVTMIHQFNPDMAPDSEFEPGVLAHLVPGNRGRMLDPRRTPIQILSLKPAIGSFVCEVLDFEDRGASGICPSRMCAGSSSRAIRAPRRRRSSGRSRRRSRASIGRSGSHAIRRSVRSRSNASPARRREAAEWLEAHSSFFRAGARLDLSTRDGEPRLWADLRAYLTPRRTWPIEEAFARQFVSHPGAGECVKGHRIVLAELGLAEYRGKVTRDPELFADPWSKPARADHILARLAFVHEVFTRAGVAEPVLYRGLATDHAPEPRRGMSFVSATFSREVAMSMFEPAGATAQGVLMRQRTPCSRLFMTYLETEPMNRHFREAEAVLLEQSEGAWF